MYLFFSKKLSFTTPIASLNVSIFVGVCYLTPLIGGYLADSFFGRYKTILIFIIVYFIGMFGISISSFIIVNNNDSNIAEILFFISLYIVGLGTGGIKPNVSTLGAEQFEKTYIKYNTPNGSGNNNDNNDLTSSELQSIKYYASDHSHNNSILYILSQNDKKPKNTIDRTVESIYNVNKMKETYFQWFYVSINCGSLVAYTVNDI